MNRALLSCCPDFRDPEAGAGAQVRLVQAYATAAATLLLFVTSARAQDSQFVFDANGNLLVQTAETNSPPQILGQPQNRVVMPGESASFFVVAADTRALAYQWRFNGTNVGGATNDALLLQNVSTNNEGQYSVMLTNSSGSVTSAPAMLWIDSRGVGIPDSWQLAYFGNLTNTATGDFDRDGVSNFQEFLDGTNPTNNLSALFHITLLKDGSIGNVIKTPDQLSYTNGQTVTLTASPGETFHLWSGDVLTRSNSITLVMTNNKTLFAHFGPVSFVWTNTADGDWDTAMNWTPNLVPGSNDTVIIRSHVTVTLNTSADCADVTLGNGGTPTLTGSGTLRVRGNFLWTDGTMSGSGRTTIAPAATLQVGSASAVILERTLENGGTALWIGDGDFILFNGVVTNRPGALFEVRSAAAINSASGANRFDNAGTFRKSVNSATATIAAGVSFNNSGAVEIQTGTLLCSGTFNNNGVVNLLAGATNRLAGGGSASGAFTAPAGTLVEWTGGTMTLDSGAQLNGTGLYRINLGTVTANANLVVENLDLVNNSATLDGTDTVTVNNVMNWTGGTMSGSGRTIIPVGATLAVANPSAVLLSTRTLENGGTILWTGAGGIVLVNGVITNRAGALFHAQNAATLFFAGGGCRFDIAGTFRKSANTGTTTVESGVSFNNYGTVDIRSGILAANGGYTSSPNALLGCALGGTTAGKGYGQLQVAGTVTLNGALSVDLLPGFSPATNDTFTILTAGSRNNTFGSFSYPSNRVTMLLSNSPNSVILSATDVFPIPQPILLTPQLVGSNVLLTWTGTSNVTYRLENNAAVGSTNWTAVPGDVTTLSNTANKFDPLTTSNRFFRIRVLP